MDKYIEFLSKIWWGQMIIGLAVYTIGIQRFYDGWDMDPIVCTIIQIVGLILVLLAIMPVLWKQDSWKETLKICLTIVVSIIFVTLAVYGNIYMWNKEPNIGNDDSDQEEEVEVTDTFIAPTSTTTLTLTPTPIPTPISTPTPPPWNFNAGYISSDWSYWPTDALNINVVTEECPNENECLDMTHYGYYAMRDEGLVIDFNYSNPETNRFPFYIGLLRPLEDFTKIDLSLSLERFYLRSESDLKFIFGIVDTENENCNMFDVGNDRCSGVFFEIYRNTDALVPELRYFDRNQTGDSQGNYLSHFYLNSKKIITISCEIISIGIMDCKYPFEDGGDGFKTKRIVMPESWDSLFIGTRIPFNSEIRLSITELDVR